MSTNKFYRLNYQIRSPQLRVVDNEGKQIGVLTLQEALSRAGEEGLDLVEIAPGAKPPVAKLIDYKKFKYEESKKERLSRRHSHESSSKEVWLGPLMSDHDLQVRLKKAREFLEVGDRVKFTVKFSGREMAHPEFGHKVLGKVKENLIELATQDGQTRFLGRNLSASFLPIKNRVQKKETDNHEVKDENSRSEAV